MSASIDRTYISKIAPYLDRSQVTSTGLSARCPSCGDSKRSKTKRRFGIVVDEDGTYCNCFNCDYSNTFRGFLKEFFPDLYTQYQKETFLERKDFSSKSKPSATRLSKRKAALFHEKSADEVHERNSSLLMSINHDKSALEYIKSRKIRETLLTEIFVTESYKKLLEAVKYDCEKNKVPDDKRIVVPLTKADGSFGGFIGRVITDPNKKQLDALRYSKNTFDEESIWIPKSLDKSMPIYVFEGFFDAALFPNSIAVLSSNLQLARKFFPDAQLIYVSDNEPENEDVMKKLKKLIRHDTRSKFFIPDSQMKGKDFNHEVVDLGFSVEYMFNYIQQRTFSFPRSALEFNLWTRGAYINV